MADPRTDRKNVPTEEEKKDAPRGVAEIDIHTGETVREEHSKQVPPRPNTNSVQPTQPDTTRR